MRGGAPLPRLANQNFANLLVDSINTNLIPAIDNKFAALEAKIVALEKSLSSRENWAFSKSVRIGLNTEHIITVVVMNLDYSNSKKSWYPDEDSKLYNAYKYRHTTVINLAKIHKREPARIIRRLTLLGLAPHPMVQQNLTVQQQKQKQAPYSNTMQWTNIERQTLINEYRIQELPLMTIADKHNRHPHNIIAEMKSLKLVKTLASITGFSEYKLSSVYADKQKEIRRINKELKNNKADEPLTVVKREMAQMKAELDRLSTFINQMFGTYKNRK